MIFLKGYQNGNLILIIWLLNIIVVVHLQKKLVHLPGFAKARKGTWHIYFGQLKMKV
jgi:hypothetical protein